MYLYKLRKILKTAVLNYYGHLKGPCLVLVIEWQPRWTNMCLSEIYRWLVHRNTYVSNTYHGGGNGLDILQGSHMWWKSSLHMRMTWSHVTKVEKINIRLGLTDWLQEWRASRGLGADGPRQRWKASEVKIDEPIWSCDDMKWIISFVDQGWCICCINIKGDRMECARQRYNL
jgi:hypothetical protein